MRVIAALLVLALFASVAWGDFWINSLRSEWETAYYSTPYNRTLCVANITNTSNVVSAIFTITIPLGGTTQSQNASSRSGDFWYSQNFSTPAFGFWSCTLDAYNTTTHKILSSDIYVDYPNDWPQYREQRRHAGFSSQMVHPVGSNWKYSTGGGKISHITTTGDYAFVPRTSGGVMPAPNSTLYALNAKTGSLRWYVNFSTSANLSGALRIYYSNNGSIAAAPFVEYNMAAETPQAVSPNVIYSTPVYDNNTGLVIVASENQRRVNAFDKNANLIWSFKTREQDVVYGGASPSCPGFGGGDLIINMSPVTPAIADGIVYVTAYNHSAFHCSYGPALFALNITTGLPIWNTSLPNTNFSRSSPVVGNNLVYVLEANGRVVAHYARNGTVAWSDATMAGTLAGWESSNTYPTVSMALANGTLHVFYYQIWTQYNATTGSPPFPPVAFAIGATTSPSISRNGKFLFGADDGSLNAYDIRSGASEWSLALGAPVYSDPAISNGIFSGDSVSGFAYGYYINLSQHNCQDPAVNCFSPNATWTTPNQSTVETLSGTVDFNATALDVGYGLDNTTVYYILFLGSDSVDRLLLEGRNVTPWTKMNNHSSGNTGAFNKTFDTTSLADTMYTIVINASDIMTNTNRFTFAHFIIDNGGDTEAPNVTFISPIDQQNVSGNLLINVSANDSDSGVWYVQFMFRNATTNATPWLNMSNGEGNTSIGHWNYTFDTTTLPDHRFYNITLNATDFLTNKNETVNISLTIDNTALDVRYNSPANGTNTTSATVSFNYTPTDSITGPYNCSLWINVSNTWAINMSNTSTLASGTATVLTPTNFLESIYIWNVQCFDFASNSAFNSSNRTVTVDLVEPSNRVILPANNSTVGHEWSIVVEANDSSSGVMNTSFRVEQNGANLTSWMNMTMVSGTLRNSYWAIVYDTNGIFGNNVYNITINVTDYSGRENSTGWVQIHKDVAPTKPDEPPPPPPPPENNTLSLSAQYTCAGEPVTLTTNAEGASVTLYWDDNGFLTPVGSGATGSDYTVSFSTSSEQPGNYEADASKAGYTDAPTLQFSMSECTVCACESNDDCPTDYVCTDCACVYVPVVPQNDTEPPDEPPPPPPPPPPGANCTIDADCADDQRCENERCALVTGECGYAANHAWNTYECCSNDDCTQEERCDLPTHTCYELSGPLPPFQCRDTCGDGGGSAICCTGYCEQDECVLNPPSTARAVELFGGVELKSACAGLGFGIDEISCNLLWPVLLVLSTIAAWSADRRLGRLVAAAAFLLPLFVGLISFVPLGIGLAVLEIGGFAGIRKKY